MREKIQTETKTETRVLGLIALCCYTATLAVMLTCGYTLLVFTLRAAGHDFAIMFNAPGL
jgi:hypothetical protein